MANRDDDEKLTNETETVELSSEDENDVDYDDDKAADAPKKKNEEAESKNVLDPEAEKVRPRFWRITILEWMVFFSTILWFLIIAIYRFMA